MDRSRWPSRVASTEIADSRLRKWREQFLAAGAERPQARVLALVALVIGAVVTLASVAGPGGWDHLGDRGAPGTDSLDLVASARR